VSGPDARGEAVLGLLGDEPATTSELYDRAGYPLLLRLGLIEYAAFRRALGALAASGLARQEDAQDGGSVWWRPADVP